MCRLVVVSSRVSAAKQTRPGAEGGLSVAVRAALRERGGIWFGWSGKVAANDYGEPTVTEAGKITYATIDLTQRDYDEYYVGFQLDALAAVSLPARPCRVHPAHLDRLPARQRALRPPPAPLPGGIRPRLGP